jgi:hypothetical protein
LIRRLDADRFLDREAAHKELLKLGEAPALLYRALPELDVEGRKRATEIIESAVSRRADRIFRYARDGRIDLLVEMSVLTGRRIDPAELWDCVLHTAWRELDASGPVAVKEFTRRFPARTYTRFLNERPKFIRESDTIDTAKMPTNLALKSDARLRGKNLCCSMAVVSGEVNLDGYAEHNILLVNGDVTVRHAWNMVIIADGDVDLGTSRRTLIVATGRISAKVELDRLDRSLGRGSPYRDLPAGHLLHLDKSSGWTPEDEAEASRKSSVRFFQPSDVGLELSYADDGVRVVAVQAKSPFATAGLKPGDTIEAIDGFDVFSVGGARHLLRRAYLLGTTELGLVSDGLPWTLRASFEGWDLPPDKPIRGN